MPTDLVTLEANPMEKVVRILEQKDIRDVVYRIITFIINGLNGLKDASVVKRIREALSLL